MKNILAIIFVIFTSTLSLFSCDGFACTRIVHIDPKAVMIGRNMDWPVQMQQQIRVYPRGMPRSGLSLEGSSIQWVSKYGSMVVTAYKDLTAEGINEHGFAVHLLSLNESDYGKRHANIQGMSIAMWAQYYLDQFENVKEAVQAALKPGYELEAPTLPSIGTNVKLHLAMEDAQGDSAVVEYVNGVPHVYTGNGNATLTNSPTYDLQLENLKKYAGFGGEKSLPGTTFSNDRFFRATYYNQHLPLAKSIDDEVFSILSIMRNVAQPYSEERPLMSYTIWQVVGDLTHRVYYYVSTTSPNMVKVSLNKFDLSVGASPMMLDIVDHPELTGDISTQFNTLDE